MAFGVHDHKKYMIGSYPDSMFLSPVVTNEVISTIASLKNKSNKMVMYSCSILKRISVIISPLLTSLINKCFVQGIFPGCLKRAFIVPVPKSGDLSLVSNYRPISILPAISKVLEKLIYKRLYGFLGRFNILFPEQYGFRSGKSTNDAINSFLQYVYDSLNSGGLVLS